MRNNPYQGFTLVEMVAVIVILGILTATAIPRFSDRSSFDARGFFDEAQSVIRYAQKVAIAQRRAIFVQVTASTVQACFDNACANFVPNPTDAASNLSVAAPNGLAITPPAVATFGFDALGRPINATGIVLAGSLVVGVAARSITVERESGYVH